MLVEKEEKDNPVLYKYKKDMDQLYGAKVDDVDFDGDTSKIQTDVNQWVRSRTNGLIDSIMDSPPDPSTTAIILNAIYFKGTWVKSFDKQNTQRRKFVTRNFEKLDADFMTMKGDRFLYQKLPLAGEEVQVLEMPYASDSMSMVILLPSRTKGVQNMMSSERFASEMETLLANLNELLSKRVINLMIPKFKLQSEYSVIPTLEKMGIKHIFTPGSADLSGINGRSDLVVSEVKHKAVVEVDEEGTEAAGGTFAAIQPPSVLVEPIRSIEFRVDHPFIFLIRDRVTGLLYFVGKVEAL